MQKLPEAPALELRGNIVQPEWLAVPADVVAEHRMRWQQRADEYGPGEKSVRMNVARGLVDRFDQLAEIHGFVRAALLDLGPPLSDEQLAEFQMLSSAALGASALLGQQPVREYLGASSEAAPDTIPPVCFDPAEDVWRWHVLPGAESSLIEDFEPDDEPEQWYQDAASGLYVQVRRPAAATSVFEEMYADYFGSPFDRHAYATVTPVAAAAAMEPVARIAVPHIAVVTVGPVA